jgi:predicted RND superfamily exporter protein
MLDVTVMFPAVVVGVIALLWFLLGCARGAFLPVSIVVLACAWTFGTMGWLDIKLRPMVSIMPVLLVAIGVADGIHILHHYLLSVAAQTERSATDIVADTMDDMLAPLTMTSVTTAAGFLSLAIAPLTEVRFLGALTAFGVMVAWLLSITMLPAVLSLLPKPERAALRVSRAQHDRGRLLTRTVARLTTLVTQHPSWLVAAFLLLLVFNLSRINELNVDGSLLENFPTGNVVLAADQQIVERFGGTQPLSLILDSGVVDGWKSPEKLRAMADMQAFIESKQYAGKPRSLVDYIKRMNEVMKPDEAGA